MANLIVFEDQQVEQLHPVALGRPAYAVTCACFHLYQFLEQLNVSAVSLVRSHLEVIQRLDFPFFTESLSSNPSQTVLASARLVPSVSNVRRLQKVLDESDAEPGVRLAHDDHGNVVVAVLPTSQVASKDRAAVLGLLEAAHNNGFKKLAENFDAICYPHDLIRFNQQCFCENIEHLIATERFKEIRDGLFAAEGAKVSDNVVIDSSAGPVLIDAGASVGPFCYFAGPVYVGPNCKVNEHSAIKDFVCLTHTVKAGGEIEATVIEPYSNKQHHGFLGHAYLGSWINLGAGTCNSDLKNTYGKVNMTYRDQKVSTDMQFVGCIIGDYSKAAINTSVFTGKLIGVCSNLYGFVSSNVPSFVNYARSFGQQTLQTVEVMQITQQRMFARRKVKQRDCDIQLLSDMFSMTQCERPDDLSTESPTL